LRISFDANVLVYAADGDAGSRHLRAADLVQRAATADCFLTLQTCGEFFHVVTRKGKLSVEKARRSLDDWRHIFPVHAATTAALDEALKAVQTHHLAFWDAMLWATVKEAGCGVLLTEDFQDGGRLASVTFVNPFEAKNAGVLDQALS
jgi:predicted nucleic acid-binding protein